MLPKTMPSTKRSIVIRQCHDSEFETINRIINTAAPAYKNIIPDDRWQESYTPQTELQSEIDARVTFWAFQRDGQLLDVVGNLVDQVIVHELVHIKIPELGKGFQVTMGNTLPDWQELERMLAAHIRSKV